MKHLLSVFGILCCLIAISCGRPNYSCACLTNDTLAKGYHIGNTSLEYANSQCKKIQAQYSWDTCITMGAK